MRRIRRLGLVAFLTTVGSTLGAQSPHAQQSTTAIGGRPSVKTHDDLQSATLPALPPGMSIADIVRGDSLYHGKGTCFVCHGVEAQGRPAAGDALTVALNWAQPNWRSIDSLIEKGIPQPLTRSPIQMPPRGGRSDLTGAEVRSVAAYVWAISQTRGEPWPGGHISHEGMSPAGADAGTATNLAGFCTTCGEAPLNYMYGHGPAASSIARLGWWLVIVSAVVVAIVTILVVAGGVRRPVKREAMALEHTGAHGELPWIYIGGLLLPALLLIVSFALTLGTLHATTRPPRDPVATVQIIGHRWWWEVRYVDRDPTKTIVTANEIHVPVGQPVRLELTSADVIHSFWVPQLAGKTDVIPGVTNIAWVQADSAGVFRGACTEYCGLQHANMSPIVVAESPTSFQTWVAGQRADASAPTDPAAAAGQLVFQKSACATCHAIRGSPTLGRVGPDLTHLASRLTLAAGTLENTRGNLAGWIANTQVLKPGNDMPVMPLASNDLQALLAYLETLK